MANNGDQPAFVPFTKRERMEQLAEIDKVSLFSYQRFPLYHANPRQNIVSLLKSTAQALQSLSKREPPKGEDTAMADSGGDQSQVFNSSMEDFLRTLRKVNVGMKRQIWGLEEADIISLPQPQKTTASAAGFREEGAEAQATNSARGGALQPDGDGKIGGLDVGWLNSRSNKVERDMEAYLWDDAENILRKLLAHSGHDPDAENKQTT
ncbi:Uu.00g094850.m01.CDS01 [Anthostomella pinea]|uniref:Mediator of RNA polymerase II transcription subunit 11 n=1 Tax=Anthostomella pinea TaxID=933095 RepID=A0AAI8VNS5_9PEZI|nr:Uu.00g094850.m01.CDS01 [Anthostomella pinea]